MKTQNCGRIPVAVVSAIILSVLALKFAPYSYVWIGAIWMLTFVLLIPACSTRRNVASVLLVLASLSASLSLAEIVLLGSYLPIAPPTYTSPYMKRMEYFLAPIPDTAARSIRVHDGEVLFDTIYTIDELGLRISPSATGAPPHQAVLFFGCSFVYGEGIADVETLPYQLGLKSDQQLKVLNLAFHGYGPHHMLHFLEDGIAASISKQDHVTHVIYGAIPDHIRRVAGRVSWGKYAPKYRLDESGLPELIGRFEEFENRLPTIARRSMDQLHKSALARLFMGLWNSPSESDIELFVAVVVRSHQLIKEQFPDAQLHVLLWPEYEPSKAGWVEERIRDELNSQTIPVHLVREILPNYEADRDKYFIPHDWHPTAYAHERVANYVWEHIAPTRLGE